MELKTYVLSCNKFDCIHSSVGECELYAVELDENGRCKAMELVDLAEEETDDYEHN